MTHAAAITLLPAQGTDALELARLSRDLVEQGLPWRWSPQRLTRLMRDPDSVVLVARSGPEIAGFATMSFAQRSAHLNLVAVAPRWQRAGIGTRLLAWLEETALVAGIERIDLELRIDNVAARRFYASRGFRRGKRVAGYYEGKEDALRMHRTLRGRAPA